MATHQNLDKPVKEEGGLADQAAIITQVSKTNAEMAKRKAERGGEEAGAKEIPMDEHTLDIEEVTAKHKTDIKEGLTHEEARARLARDGPNELSPPPSLPWYVVFMQHMTGFFSLLLWGAAVLCFIAYGIDSNAVDNLYLGIVLAVVVFLTGCFSYYQDAQADAVMQGFKKLTPTSTIVTREGKAISEFPATDIVVGDIVTIKNGKKIPADIRMFETASFKVDNSSMTGEPEPQERFPKKDPKDKRPLEATNVAFYGTLCNEGNGKGIVIATGDRTVIGRIAKLASTAEEEETPIAQEIEHFIKIISSVAIILGIIFLIIGIVNGFNAIDNVVFCIGIIVANVPEGLLATVTVSLTLTAKRMEKKHVLVKNLEAVETLGSTSVIASDKTGTLTQNRMTVAHLYYNRKIHNPNEIDRKDPTFQVLHKLGVCCATAEFKEKPVDKPVSQWPVEGDAGETAFMKYFQSIEDIKVLRDANPREGLVPFKSANKFMVSINQQDCDPSKPRIMMFKGAPERVWSRCDYVLHEGKPE
eukprot:49402-Amorphochlora_amoeboformis.AAC.2